MTRCAVQQRGFTLVEAVIGVVLATMLIISAYQVFTYISRQRSRGDVDLQELQGARHAINYLRRDFRSATPQIADSATLAQKRKALRMPIVEASSFSIGNEAVPVLISDGEIHFFKHLYDTPDGVTRPATEQVNYRIDSAHKCLVRSVAGVDTVFKDIKDARFELYAHPLNPALPMLLVTLRINADQKNDKTGEFKFFEMTTTISSAVTSPFINNPNWHIAQD
jgi:type II secretory pathway component PulJ